MSVQLGLARISTLLNHLSSPHRHLPVVHIAGTNGKGSVSAILDAILSRAGLRVGRFNSPHLRHPSDSIVVNGDTVDIRLYDSARKVVDSVDERERVQASPFERLTATAINVFHQAQPPLDICIFEVGMGGADDATNVFPQPLLTILTTVDLDHQAFLGSTIAAISRVKCGIIKLGRPLILGPQQYPTLVQPVVDTFVTSLNAPLHRITMNLLGDSNTTSSGPTADLINPSQNSSHVLPPPVNPSIPPHTKLRLPGQHQFANASTAVYAARLLGTLQTPEFDGSKWAGLIDDENISAALENVQWPGRMEWLDVAIPPQPRTSEPPPPQNSHSGRSVRALVDGAHNRSSAACLRVYIESQLSQQRSLPTSPNPALTIIVAVSHPRDPLTLLSEFIPSTLKISSKPVSIRIICTKFSTPDEMPWIQATDVSSISKSVEKLFSKLRKDLPNSKLSLKSVEADNISKALEIVADDENNNDDSDSCSSPLSSVSQPPLVVICGSLYLVSDLARLQSVHVDS